MGQHDGIPVSVWEPSANIETAWRLPLGGIHELTRALSLVCNVAVETPIIWTDYGDHAHFGQRYGNTIMGTREPTPRTATEITLTAALLKEAIQLQPELCKPPANVETALDYWLKSKARRPDAADRLVFLRTALEALFLDRGNQAELAFRLGSPNPDTRYSPLASLRPTISPAKYKPPPERVAATRSPRETATGPLRSP